MHAMLLSSAEVGYKQVTVELICERFGGSAQQFHSEFADKADCFAAAYEFAAEPVHARLLACIERDATCGQRVEAAIAELIELASNEPETARALFIEVHVAGKAPLKLHRELMRRLSRAIESLCDPETIASMPSITAEFAVAVVEQAFSTSLAKESLSELEEATPELAAILSQFYGRT